MANPIDATGDALKATGGMGKKAWNLSRGFIAAATVSTIIAAQTGGINIVADVAMAAGDSIKFTPMDMLSNVGQGFTHNLHGGADILSGWMAPDPTQ